MLHLLLRVLSFFLGEKLQSPAQARQQRLELENQKEKITASDTLISKLRAELQRQQLQSDQTLNAKERECADRLNAKQAELDSLNDTLNQLNDSIDLENQRRLRENKELLDQLNWVSGTIAHDFRAPLRAIDAYAFFLADDLGANTPPEAMKSLDEIRRNGQRMGVLIDALIEYLRVGVCPMSMQKHDLPTVIQQVIDEHFDFSPVPIEVQLQGPIRCDKSLFSRLIKELLDNAVKFSKPVAAPKILIRQTSPLTIEILDNGVGFSQAHEAQKFQLFHRMHGNDEFEGEGVGLALSQRIASRHEMRLSLTRVGEQTVASLQLPESV